MNDNTVRKPVVIIGGGGHASVIVDILKQQNREIVAIISPIETISRKVFSGIEVLRCDMDISRFGTDDILLVNGIGKLPDSDSKKKVNEFFLSMGYKFDTVIADTAYVSPYPMLDEGVQIFHGAIVQAGVHISAHTVINTMAVIEHDSYIGEYNFISPGAILCGQCKTGNDVFIGAGSTLIQNVELGDEVIIMASALVTNNILPGQKVYAQRSAIK